MLKIIDEDVLPNFLGGSGNDELEKNIGPWNPLGLEIYGKK